MEETNEEREQRREYSRVEAYLPFEYRIVADEEKDHLQARIAGSAAAENRPFPETGEFDQGLGEWFQIINAKLDSIIRMMTLQHEGYTGLAFKAVNISGGGMSFLLPEPVKLGETLEIKLMLTLNRPVALSVYGEVTKSEPRNGRYFTAVRYVQMDATVRDEIIRFVFEREREIIREKRR